MDPGSRRPASSASAGAGVQVLIADTAWRRFLPRPEALAARAARAAGGGATVVLANDTIVKQLNARYRGRNKPTNVLTFDPPSPGMPGEIVLALGTVRREAGEREAGTRGMARHTAHLVVHGALHLQGHDHHHAGAARRMERAEARILGRMGLPNPWKRS